MNRYSPSARVWIEAVALAAVAIAVLAGPPVSERPLDWVALGLLVGKGLASSAPAAPPVGDLAALDARKEEGAGKPPARRAAPGAEGSDSDAKAAAANNDYATAAADTWE